MTQKRKKQVSLLIFLAGFVFLLAVSWFVGRPMIRFVSNPQQFRVWVEQSGMWSRVLFVGMVIFQVLVAFIPGEPLEIGAGYAFGVWEGTVLCLLGITIGSILIFLLVRRFGVQFVELFFSVERIRSVKFLQKERRLTVIAFFVFLIPGTPKDILSYFVGLTSMKLSTWIAITTLARIPSVVTSTVGGQALNTKNYLTAVLVLGVTAALSLGGWFVYKLWSGRRQERRESDLPQSR